MSIEKKIAELIPALKPGMGNDVAEMTEDIYYHLSKLEQFEVLRAEQTGDPNRMLLAACITTMKDPFFKIVITHIWEQDLAFDNQWCEFEDQGEITIFRFLTWEDEYISGEIWFDRSKPEIL